MSTTPERWLKVKEILERAWELNGPERTVYLQQACAHDPSLRVRVEELMASDQQAGEFLRTPLANVASALGLEDSQLGPYRILREIGRGGMGAVYLAERADGVYQKRVALKLVTLAGSEELLRRFVHERQILANLEHANIARLLDGGSTASGTPYLVMEYVDGSTLAERISQGPIPLPEALTIVGQIADALEAAHAQGIVHRDLKPANIKITPEGGVKVLDFGIAKGSASPDDGVLNTGIGSVLGTPSYMAPEQARGQHVDKRSDIWAFGVVLYEMVTGMRAFPGDTTSDVLAAVLTRDPDLEHAPASVKRLLTACLEKDARKRLRDIGDWERLLDGPPPPPARPRRALPWILAAAATIVAISLWAFGPRSRPALPLLRLDLELGGEASQVALSRDGLQLAFVLKGQLAVRRLDSVAITPLPGTEGASFPFFSPDGQWIGFFAGGKLRKIAPAGGPAVILCDAPNGRGASWGDDEHIVAALHSSAGLARVSAQSGKVERLTDLSVESPEGVISHRWPHVLPGGRGILFGHTTNGRTTLRVLPPEGGPARVLVEDSASGRYVDGFLIYHLRGTLFAARMDLDGLTLTGAPAPLLEDVAYNTTGGRSSARHYSGDFDVSSSGTLVFRRGTGPATHRILGLDPSGRTEPILAAPDAYLLPRLSPDGQRVAVSIERDRQVNLWIYDLASGAKRRIGVDSESQIYPVWSPDGAFLVFSSGATLAWARFDGSGPIERLAAASRSPTPSSFSPNGKWLAYYQNSPETENDLWISPVERAPGTMRLGEPRLLLRQPTSQTSPAISPDGRWVAYHSYESGRAEVYVMPFTPEGPANGAKWQVSTEGGAFPLWSQRGNLLFFRDPSRYVMVADCTSRDAVFRAGKPRKWAAKQLAEVGAVPSFDVGPDGRRVIGLFDREDAPPASGLHVMLNVGDELRRRSK